MTIRYVDVHEVEADDLIFGVRWRPVARIVFDHLRWTYYDGEGIIIQSAVIGSRIQIIKES